MELLGPGLALIVATIIFGLLLHFLENRDSDEGPGGSQGQRGCTSHEKHRKGPADVERLGSNLKA